MKISYYMPLKPPDHDNPSGDLITGRELSNFLIEQNHQVDLASSLRSRWIYWNPMDILRAKQEQYRLCKELQHTPAALWLTYHSYYKAPDLLGPACSRAANIAYVVFQGIYSTKRRRSLKILPGFLLNRKALTAAQMVCTNKKKDEKNLRRLLPEERIQYIAPGLQPQFFCFDDKARRDLRKQWQVGTRKVVLSTAMLRPGVKSEGIRQVLHSCATLNQSGNDILLIVVGDGRNRLELERQAQATLGPNCLFLGKISRPDLYRYYSAADLFAFPGIEESLGMVYLEAQSVGLPVVAFGDWGASEAVIDKQTGLLTPASEPQQFTQAMKTLLSNNEMRQAMAESARKHIRHNHDLTENYHLFLETIHRVVECYARGRNA